MFRAANAKEQSTSTASSNVDGLRRIISKAINYIDVIPPTVRSSIKDTQLSQEMSNYLA